MTDEELEDARKKAMMTVVLSMPELYSMCKTQAEIDSLTFIFGKTAGEFLKNRKK